MVLQSLQGAGGFLVPGEHRRGRSHSTASSCLGAGSRNQNEGRRQTDVMVVEQLWETPSPTKNPDRASFEFSGSMISLQLLLQHACANDTVFPSPPVKSHML